MLILAHLGQSHAGWNLVTMSVLAATAWLFLRGPGGRSERRQFLFVTGLIALMAALASPLETLAEELASAHMFQHVLLLLVAAPLLAASRPVEGLVGGLPRRWRKTVGRVRRMTRLTPEKRRLVTPVLVWMAYGGALWVWHAAGLYELALQSSVVHVVEHLCFIVAGVAFWSLVLVGRRRPDLSPGLRGLMVFTTAFHSVLLAALITFADRPWYDAYAETAAHWGLTAIDDQRLAGLLMWIPGGLVYSGTGLWILLGWVRNTGEGLGPDAKPATQGSQRR